MQSLNTRHQIQYQHFLLVHAVLVLVGYLRISVVLLRASAEKKLPKINPSVHPKKSVLHP
jgi:hypothetical protein